LCKALLGELSQNEGIWIDALCIDQECKEEKLHTIPAMDLIYKKARLTVVVLSDICLDRAEKTLLRDLACIRPWLGRHKRSFDSERKLNQLIAQRHSNTGLPTDEHLTRSIEDDPTGFLARKRQYEEKYYKHPAFKSFVKKLLSAEWFTRAWCWHEFRMSGRSVYLVRCDSENEVLRFTDVFLLDLITISFDHNFSSFTKDHFVALEVFQSLTRNWGREQDVSQSIREECAKEPLSQVGRMIQNLHTGGDRDLSGEERRADGIRDKLYMALNIAGCGLYYKGPRLKMCQWFGQVGTLGLATGDPHPLFSSGPQLFTDGEPSWLHIPANTESPGVSGVYGIDNYPSLEGRSSAFPTPYPNSSFSPEEVSIDDSGKFRYISLRLVLLDSCRAPTGSDEDSEFTEPKAIEYAEWFINNWKELDHSFESEGSHLAINRTLMKVATKFMLSLEKLKFYTDILASCLVFGIEWMKNADRPQPSEEFDKEELENAYRLVFGSLDSNGLDQASALLQSDDGYKAATLLFSYIHSLLLSGLPLEIGPRVENWEVQRFQSESGKRVLLFAPKLTKTGAIKAAVPDQLLLDEYKDYYRVWLLVEHKLDGTQCLRLLSKTRLIGEVPEFCSEVLASGAKAHRKVYGATREMLAPLGDWAAGIEGAELSGGIIDKVIASPGLEYVQDPKLASVLIIFNALAEAIGSKEGSKYQGTLTKMNEIAETLRGRSKYEAAEEMHRRTLELRKNMLGPEHPDTLTSMNNLAEILRSQDKYEAAEEMHRRALELREKVLGPEHLDTLASMSNLTEVLSSQGKYEAAGKMRRRMLEQKKEALGPEHPDAGVLGDRGKYEAAEKIHLGTLGLKKKVLSPEPDAGVLGSRGEYEAVEKMSRVALEVMEVFGGNPDTLTSISELAENLRSLGRYEAAEEIHRRTLELREKMLGPEHQDTLASMHQLGWTLSSQGKYEAAEEMHRAAMELQKKVLGHEHQYTLGGMFHLAAVLGKQGKYEAAEEIHWRTLELREKALGPEHPATLTSMIFLAVILGGQGKYEAAEEMYQRTLVLMEKVTGPEHLKTLTIRILLAEILRSQGKNEAAEAMHQRALALMEKALSPEHPDARVFGDQGKHEAAEEIYGSTMGLIKEVLGPKHPDTLTSMNKLAEILSSQGKYEEAEEIHRRTLELRKDVLGPEHPDTLTSMDNLGLVLMRQGNYEEAEEIHRRALELRKNVLGSENPDTLTSMNSLALVLRKQGKYEVVEEMHRRTLNLRKKVLGPEHPDTLISMSNLALVLSNQGKNEAADEMRWQALELRKKVLGPEHLDTLADMADFAALLSSHGKYEKAEEMQRRTLELREKVQGSEHQDTLACMSGLGLVLMRAGNYEEAEEMHRRALELTKNVLGSEHPYTLPSMVILEVVLSSRGKYKEAEEMHWRMLELIEVQRSEHLGTYEAAEKIYRWALELMEVMLGSEHPATLTSMNRLAEILGSQGKYEAAEEMHRRTLELREKVLGSEHPDTLASRNNLALVLDS
jgi:tetratricopeptide (TPR) repeat protein